MAKSRSLIRPFTNFVERFFPDSFVFAILITVITFALAFFLTDASETEIILAWGGADGLPKLLAFTAQLCITLLAAHALAHTDLASGFLRRISAIPKSATTAYALVAFVSGLSALVAWSFCLVVGGVLARDVAASCKSRGISVHYPLLVASAYAGLVIWHMGYSGTAPLFVASPDHSLINEMGILPITETVFTLRNGLLALIALIAITVICPMMRPPREDTLEIEARLISRNTEEIEPKFIVNSFAERLEHMRALSSLLGLLLLTYVAVHYYNKGFELTLNIVNWTFLGAGLLLARSPMHYVKLIQGGSKTIGPIILQYPFYAGILGIMTGTGLVAVFSDWFASVATDQTLGLWAFLSAGLVNIFIPSGGGQWAVQGPVFIDTANQLGVEHDVIVMAIAYGDQWSNMIQPFWTLPLLAIAGLNLRQIMGYTMIIFLVTGLIFGGGLLMIGAG